MLAAVTRTASIQAATTIHALDMVATPGATTGSGTRIVPSRTLLMEGFADGDPRRRRGIGERRLVHSSSSSSDNVNFKTNPNYDNHTEPNYDNHTEPNYDNHTDPIHQM